MWKKVIIQIILFSLVIFLIFFTYKTYFKSEENVKIDEINNYQEEFEIVSKNLKPKKTEEDSNLVKSLKYVSRDIEGNEYIIMSKYSELNLESINIINMIDVSAKITMINKEPLFVTSDYATYNNESYETNFFDNVVINYLDSKINSEKFNVSIENNFASVSEKVKYQNSNVKLEADIIEIDLLTKNSKIFMINENKKIKIINK